MTNEDRSKINRTIAERMGLRVKFYGQTMLVSTDGGWTFPVGNERDYTRSVDDGIAACEALGYYPLTRRWETEYVVVLGERVFGGRPNDCISWEDAESRIAPTLSEALASALAAAIEAEKNQAPSAER